VVLVVGVSGAAVPGRLSSDSPTFVVTPSIFSW
jgi:hypothetical protein